MSAPANIMVIAGEVSGDLHAAPLVRAIRQREPGATFFGIGGEHMRAEGVETLYDVSQMAVVGLSEVVKRFAFFRRVFLEMVAILRERKPAAVILVDYPGFNLRFAGVARAAGVKVIYYICPQVWAWRRSRIRLMAKRVDRLVTIFPFEARYFEHTDLRVDFAGHPLVDEAAEVRASDPAPLPWQGEPRIALLPGSREHEVRRMLPDMWNAAVDLESRHPQASFIVAAPTEPLRDLVHGMADDHPAIPTRWKVVTGETRQVLRQSRAAIVASGTATIEAALMRCPMAIIYRMAPMTYFIGRLLIRIPHIGMVNIVAGKRAFPELLQHHIQPGALTRAMEPMLAEGAHREQMLADLDEIRTALGSGGAAERAAGLVLDELA